MHIADLLKIPNRLPPQLGPQNAIYPTQTVSHLSQQDTIFGLVSQNHHSPHLGLRRPLLRNLQRNLKHFLRSRNRVDEPIGERLLTRPPMGLQQHLSRNLRPELEAGERTNALEVKAEIDGREAYEAS